MNIASLSTWPLRGKSFGTLGKEGQPPKVEVAPPQDTEPQAGSPRLEGLKKVAQNFESVFLQMVLKSMRATVQKNNYFGTSYASGIYTQMLDQTLTDSAARNGRGYGIADAMVRRYGRYVQDSTPTPKPEAKKEEKKPVQGTQP
jgi:Rod binding domain-containing protein